MRYSILKLFWVIVTISQLLLIIPIIYIRVNFELIEDMSQFPLYFWIFGIITSLISHIIVIQFGKVVITNDKIDEEFRKIEYTKREVLKFKEFLEFKAFESKIVSKEEINKHMGW